jgi:hypothetical protein
MVRKLLANQLGIKPARRFESGQRLELTDLWENQELLALAKQQVMAKTPIRYRYLSDKEDIVSSTLTLATQYI